MKAKNRKRLRVLGKILFVLYIGFLFYFLIFSDWYGREGTGEYHYNLVLFCEIKRFWLYRDVLGWVAYANLFGNVRFRDQEQVPVGGPIEMVLDGIAVPIAVIGLPALHRFHAFLYRVTPDGFAPIAVES
mgnify:CR=1 FL=1